MSKKTVLETDLYPPVKALLEGQGYEVKGEVGAADVVACRGDEDPVIVELKTGFSLSLFHQGIERQAITDSVYIAVPRGSGAAAWKAIKNNLKLCRRLGLGLLTVRLKDGLVEIHADPAPYKPRKSKQKKARLLREFAKRVGDPGLSARCLAVCECLECKWTNKSVRRRESVRRHDRSADHVRRSLRLV